MQKSIIVLGAIAGLALTGCASQSGGPSSAAQELQQKQRQISSLEQRLSQHEAEVADQGSQIETLSQRLAAEATRGKETTPAVASGGELLPPNAKPGECYARVFVPAQYGNEEVRVLKRAASEKIEIIPARYETVTERVLVSEPGRKLEVIPATYGTVEERVMVRPASTRLEEVPAQYGWEEEQVLVTPAQTVWKKGRGPVERVDTATGEIMCLVDEPAVYKTVKRRVLLSPASTRAVEVPAEYQTLKKRVMKTPPTTREVEVPAQYRTVKVRKLTQPEREVRKEIPAQYATVTKRPQISEGQMAWRPVLCETNATPQTVASIQRALAQSGHSPGPIDGVIGRQTLAAVQSFQSAKSLPRGGLNFATIEALGVPLGR